MKKTDITLTERLLTAFFAGLVVFLIDLFGPLFVFLKAGGAAEVFYQQRLRHKLSSP